MSKREIMKRMLKQGNGHLFTGDVIKKHISKTYLAQVAEEMDLVREAHGVYIAHDSLVDELYVIGIKNRKVCFSHETALFLHGLMEREPFEVTVTVKEGYNASHLRKKRIRVFQTKEEFYSLGLSSIKTLFGNPVTVYDLDKTICDIVRIKDKMDIQVFQTAMKAYVKRKDKNLPNLMRYAKVLRVEGLIRKYMEVLL